MATKMMNKFECYWNVIHDIMEVATVLDSRYKMGLLEYYYEKLYPVDFYVEINKIRQLCYDLVFDNQLRSKVSGCASQSMDSGKSNVGDDLLNEFDKFVERQIRTRTTSF